MTTKDESKSSFVPLICPFCNEADFDSVGLKMHLECGWCESYNSPGDAKIISDLTELVRMLAAYLDKAGRFIETRAVNDEQTQTAFQYRELAADALKRLRDEHHQEIAWTGLDNITEI